MTMFGSEQMWFYVARKMAGSERIRVSGVFSRVVFSLRGRLWVRLGPAPL